MIWSLPEQAFMAQHDFVHVMQISKIWSFRRGLYRIHGNLQFFSAKADGIQDNATALH